MPDLGEGAAACRVVDNHRQTRRLTKPFDDGHVAPRQHDRRYELTSLVIYEAGKTDANPRDLDKLWVLSAQARDLTADLSEERTRVFSSLEAIARDETVLEVAQGENGFVGAHIKSENAEA